MIRFVFVCTLVLFGASSHASAAERTRYQAAKDLISGRYVVLLHDKVAIHPEKGRKKAFLVDASMSHHMHPNPLAVLFDLHDAKRFAKRLAASGVELKIELAKPEHFGIPHHSWDLSNVRQVPLHSGFGRLVTEDLSDVEESEGTAAK